MKSLLLGLAVGDALGVPVEFEPRAKLANFPVTGMRDGGTHNQPAGTWSDDTSLSLCLAESIADDYSVDGLARKIISWHKDGLWTAHGDVFDIGYTTAKSILNLKKGVTPSGLSDEYSNGNGSLMRIAPLVFYVKDKSIEERFEIIRQASSITHGHIRSVIACFYYLEFARHLLLGADGFRAYFASCGDVDSYVSESGIEKSEIRLFHRIFNKNIYELKSDQIRSDGYVLHTLEASIWCLLTTDSYKDAVLKAVNLGGDTDTTGCVTGALAGLYYGEEAIPEEWLPVLARREDIEALAERMPEGVE